MTDTAKLPSVQEYCSDFLDENYFNREDWSLPSKEFPSLSDWKQNQKALLHLQENVNPPVPSNPEKKEHPLLLLWNLQDEKHKNSEAYKYLADNQGIHPTALYATSGGGKTRSILEYLSHNIGIYLLANKSKRDPGSKDFETCVHRGVSEINNLHSNTDNISAVCINIKVLVCVRCLVYIKLCDFFGSTPTSFQWLMFQLFPETFIGVDVFMKTAHACLMAGRRTNPTVDLETVDDFFLERNLIKACSTTVVVWTDLKKMFSSIFVDEAQMLLRSHDNGKFFRSEDNDEVSRSSFTAVLKAFCEASVLFDTFATFAGTGMSFDELYKQSRSALAKHSVDHDDKCIFMDFDQFDADAVQTYLNYFFDFRNVSDDLKMHLCNWIRGRPRWTANFIEMYISKEPRQISFGTRGDFNQDEKKIVQALDRYLANMTEKPGTNIRNSWPPGDSTSVYARFDVVMNMKGFDTYRTKKYLERLIFVYATTGNPVKIKERHTDVIEKGLAAVSVNENSFEGVLNEPIIIQAGINYFDIAVYCEEEMDTQSNKGIAFEKFTLPYLSNNLEKVVAKQLPKSNPFDGFRLSRKSSYGVLAKKVEGCDMDAVRSTLAWIKVATEAKIEGSYPPVCFPDNYIGTDLLCLLWNDIHTQYRSVLSQLKFRPDFSQPDALRTMVPDFLYHNHKGKGDNKRKRDKGTDGTGQSDRGKKIKRTKGTDGMGQSDSIEDERDLNDQGCEGANGMGGTSSTDERDHGCNLKDDKTGQEGTYNRNVPVAEWLNVKPKLIQDGTPCLRLMVQYPKDATKAAVGGTKSHQGTIQGCSDKSCNKTHGFLVTVDRQNAESLFGDSTVVLQRNANMKD